MATYLSDTFTGLDGVGLSAHVGETGAAWTPFPGLVGAQDPVIASGRLHGLSAIDYWAASGNAAADGETASIAINKLSTLDSACGVMARCNPAGSRCYMAWWHTNGQLNLFRLDNNTTLTTLTGKTQAMPSGASTLMITVTGTGASVRVDCHVDGVLQLSYTDSTASRLVTPGRAGLYFGGATGATTGVHIDAISGADSSSGAATITLTAPVDGTIRQRSGSAGSIAVAGSYTAAPASIEGRLVLDGTSTAVSGFDWATVVGAPAGGVFAFSFANVPQGGWYNVQLRDPAAPGTVFTSGKVGVGVLIAILGQSNAYNWFRIGAGSQSPDGRLRANGDVGTWVTPAAASCDGAIAFGNALVATLGVPVGLLDLATDGSGLHAGTFSAWLPTSGSAYAKYSTGLTAVGGKCEAIVWVQGETDGQAGVSQANYYADLGTLFAAFRAAQGQASLPVVLATLGRIPLAGYGTDATLDAIRAAQVQKCGDANIYRVDREDVPTGADDIHHTAAGFVTLGRRCALAVQAAIGVVAHYRGPRIGAASWSGGYAVDVGLIHDSGNDVVPASGASGFRVLDGATPIGVANAARVSGSILRLTLATVPVNPPTVQYLWGKVPDVSAVVRDNSSLGLPLEYNSGIVASQSTDGVAPGCAKSVATVFVAANATGTTGASDGNASGASFSASCILAAGSGSGSGSAGSGQVLSSRANQLTALWIAALPINRQGRRRTSWVQGEAVRLSVAVSDIDGLAISGAGLVLRVKAPNGNLVTYTTSAGVVCDQVGAYHSDIVLDTPGVWVYRWESGPPDAGVSEGSLIVRKSLLT